MKLKTFLIAATVAILCGVAVNYASESLGPIWVDVDNVVTNGGGNSVASTDRPKYGRIECVYLEVSGYATPTVNVTVATGSTGGLGVAQTILQVTNVTASGVYPVADLRTTTSGVDISGEPYYIFIWDDYINVTVTNLATNATTDVRTCIILR